MRRCFARPRARTMRAPGSPGTSARARPVRLRRAGAQRRPRRRHGTGDRDRPALRPCAGSQRAGEAARTQPEGARRGNGSPRASTTADHQRRLLPHLRGLADVGVDLASGSMLIGSSDFAGQHGLRRAAQDRAVRPAARGLRPAAERRERRSRVSGGDARAARPVAERPWSARGGKNWRRERDSNPRRAFDPYTLSRGAPSTTRPSLRGLDLAATGGGRCWRGPVRGAAIILNDLTGGKNLTPAPAARARIPAPSRAPHRAPRACCRRPARSRHAPRPARPPGRPPRRPAHRP